MAIEDLIRIRGDVTDTAPLQGIGPGVSGNAKDPITVNVSTSGGGALEVVTGGAIDDALWAAQTAIITGESAYLTQLNAEWIAVKDNLDSGVWRTIWTTISETFEEVLSLGVFTLLAKYGIVLSGGAAAVVGVLVSLAAGYGLGKLEEVFAEWLDKGNALLVAMKAENTAMLAAEQTGQNYQHRNDVISRHERMIARLLDELDQMRQGAETMLYTSGGGSTTTEEEEDGWDTVITGMVNSIENLDEWVEEMETQDDANLPVPSAPGLPTIPTDPRKVLAIKIGFLLAKYLFKLITEILRKQRETDTNLTDLTIAMKAMVEKMNEVNANLEAIGEIDAELRLPNSNARINIFGRTVRYGGQT